MSYVLWGVAGGDPRDLECLPNDKCEELRPLYTYTHTPPWVSSPLQTQRSRSVSPSLDVFPIKRARYKARYITRLRSITTYSVMSQCSHARGRGCMTVRGVSAVEIYRFETTYRWGGGHSRKSSRDAPPAHNDGRDNTIRQNVRTCTTM